MQVRVVLDREPASAAVDAVVRPCGRALEGPGGVELLSAAGPQTLGACRELRRLAFRRGLGAGEAVSTTAGDLAARWLIHVHVPEYTPRDDRAYLFTASYRSVLAVADDLGARTLAMAALGSTLPYWPLEQASRLGLGTLLNTTTQVREVTLHLSSAGALEVFSEALARRRDLR
jgi:O-acetyl-ADP-ribose deacetylase (regulator of RNase III)